MRRPTISAGIRTFAKSKVRFRVPSVAKSPMYSLGCTVCIVRRTRLSELTPTRQRRQALLAFIGTPKEHPGLPPTDPQTAIR